jgi:enediyne biosynthesis thioesterase
MSLQGAAGNRITMAFDYLRVAGGPGTSPPAAPELIARGRQTVAVMVREGEQLRPSAVPEELTTALLRYGGAGTRR